MKFVIAASCALLLCTQGCLYKKGGKNVPPVGDIATDVVNSDAVTDGTGRSDSITPPDGKEETYADLGQDLPKVDLTEVSAPTDVTDAVETVSPDTILPDLPADHVGDQVTDITKDAVVPPDVVEVVDTVPGDTKDPDTTLTDALTDGTTADLPVEPDVIEDTAPDVITPTCSGIAALDGMACHEGRSNKVPGIRLMFSVTGSSGDNTVCGPVSWKLGNRILLYGTTPDGISKGRLTGVELWYDLDEDLEDDMYTGSDGQPQGYPLVIELLDQDQNVVWRGRRREPLQVREYVWSALKAQTGMDPSSGLVSMVNTALGADFEAYTTIIPDLPDTQFIRFSRDWSLEEKASVTTCDTSKPLVMPTKYKSSGSLTPTVNLADIPQVPITQFTDKVGLPEVVKVYGISDSKDAVNFVILSEGYTADQKAKFQTEAAAVAAYVAELEPFKQFNTHLNVWSVWTPSADPGASYDCACTFYETATQPCTLPHDGCEDAKRNNVYGSVFAVRALMHLQAQLIPGSPAPSLSADRNIFPMFLFRVGMAMSLSDSSGEPISGDAAFILINEDKEGAFGLFNAAVTTAYQNSGGMVEFTEVATHEMGHAFGLLGDEYATSTDVCQLFELTPLFPNFSPIPATQADIPWTQWVTLSGPYPNSEADGAADSIGCFVPAPGGGLCKDAGNNPLLCRPMKTCKMKTNGGDFCPICTDHVVHRIFNRIDIMDSDVFEFFEESSGVYQVSMPVSMPDVEGTWTFDGSITPMGALGIYTLDTNSLAPGEHVLELTVTYPTPLSRVWTQALTETKSVTITIP